MSVTGQMDRIKSNVSDTYDALLAKGAAMPTVKNSENLPKAAESISVPTKLSDLADDNMHRTVSDTEKAEWNGKSDFSGRYNDLAGKPTIPTVVDSVTSTSTTTAASSNAAKKAYDLANAAMPKTGGTFTGIIHAGASNQTYSSYLLRQSRLSTTELTPTNNGEICWVYE